MIKFITIGFFLSLSVCTPAQIVVDTNTIEISSLSEFVSIINKCDIYIDSTGTASAATISNDAWKPLASYNTVKYIPVKWITKTIYLKFTLLNNADSTNKIYFIAGSYVRSMSVFKIMPGKPPVELEDKSRRDGYQPITLNKGERQDFIAKFNFTKRNLNYIRPLIINDGYLLKYQNLRYFKNDAQPAVGYLLGGILLMMILFTAANYWQSKKKEFLYNCLYSICMFGLIFLNTFLERRSGILSSLFHEYLDFMLLSSGTIFYIAFTRKFLDTKANYPLLNKIFVFEEKLVVTILASFTFIVFFTDNFWLQKAVENGMKFIVLIIGIVYIVIALSKKNKLMNYLAIGNALLIFFSIISFLMILFPNRNVSLLSSSMIYYEVGIISELIFFLFL